MLKLTDAECRAGAMYLIVVEIILQNQLCLDEVGLSIVEVVNQ